MPRRKVLVVEDSFVLFDELCDFFEEKGFGVLKGESEAAVDNYDDAIRLVRQHKPDIAVLDIHIKGEKDGIDIGCYIQEHYHIPVIYLSEYPTAENLERIRRTRNERFVFKATKPLNKEQLWSMFYLALPQGGGPKEKSTGKFFTVKEMKVVQTNNQQRVLQKEADEPIEIQTFLKWEDIVFIESFNAKTAGTGNNNVLIHTIHPGKAYVLRGSLTEIENELPNFFARFDQSTILNLHKITGRIKGSSRYLIGELVFKLSDTYKGRNEGKDFPPFD